MAKVKFRTGTYTAYKALSTKDEDTLYFTTDTKLIFKGSDLLTDYIVSAVKGTSGTGADATDTFTITTAAGETYEFSTVSKTAVSSLISSHNVKATASVQGHVKLTDNTASTSSASEGIAATPKLVADAISAAKEVLGNRIDGIVEASNAMIFRGTLGSEGSGATATSLPTTFSAGDTYKVITDFTDKTYGIEAKAGDLIIALNDYTSGDKDYWIVVDVNEDGTVTTTENLTSDALVVATGNATVATLAKGTSGQVLSTNANGQLEWKTPETFENTTYEFENGSNGSFTVTSSATGKGVSVSIGKPATAGTADNVGNNITVKLNSGTTEGTNMFTFNGSAAKTVNITPTNIGAAESGHGHALTDAAITGTLPVSKGGTGATTIAALKTTLGLGPAAAMAVDTAVKEGSENLVTSDAVNTAIEAAVEDLEWGTIGS